MAQLALAVVGAQLGAGFAGFAGLTGAQLGWLGGSLLGSFLGQKAVHNVQPGIGDRSIQASTYGAFKTLNYGTMRLAGNVIDGVGEVREVLTTTRIGKGGPKGSNTTRSWNADVAIDLCQAGAQGIRKIWNSGKLIYDVSTDATAGAIIASTARARSFKFYDGSESQLPDPTLEALHGPGNVPAYRGRSYVVFAGMDCPNGQIPQLSFEVSMSITESATLLAITPAVALDPDIMYATGVYSSVAFVIGPDVVYHMAVNNGNGGSHGYAWSAQGYKLGNGYSKKLWATELVDRGTGAYGPMVGLAGSHKNPMVVRGTLTFNGTYSTANNISLINMLTGEETVIRTYVPGTVDYDFVPGAAAYDEITGKFVIGSKVTGGRTYERFNPQIYDENVGGARVALPSTAGVPLAFYNDIVYSLDQRSGQTYVQSWDGTTGAFIDEIGGGPSTIDITGYQSGYADGQFVSISAHAGGVFVYSKELNTAWRIEDSWIELSDTVPNSDQTTDGIKGCWIEEDYVCEGPLTSAADALLTYRIGPFKSFAPLSVTLSSVVSDICLNSGLTAGEIVVSELASDLLYGYSLTKQSSGRAALEPLMKAYFIVAREQDGKIDFIHIADQVSVVTIPFDDLAAYELSGDIPDAFSLSRTDDLQLPRSVSVSYIDYEADFQTGTQVARRQTAETSSDQSVEIPMAITAGRAATIAEVFMYDAWSQRNARVAPLQRKYSYLSPGDVIEIEYPRDTFTEKRITSANDDGSIVRLDLVDGDAPLYDADIVGASMPPGQDSPGLTSPTELALLDLPILRDADAGSNAIIAALAGYTTPWSGGVLYKGNTDATLGIVGSVTVGAEIGIATTALGDWTQNTVDWLNTVTVEQVGTLSSCTLDDALNDDVNSCVIGTEVLKYLTATYVSAGTYVLSNLIRGQRGTERNRGTHTVYEKFVSLSGAGVGLIRVEQDLGELNLEKLYRAVSLGQSVDDEISVNFASTGVALKPFAPVNFKRVALNGTSRLTWDRRTRLSGEFIDGGDVPLGESSELYYVDIYTDATFTAIKRTIATNTPQADYTLAQQVTDWGGYAAQLYLRISQVSSIIGRGFPLEVSSFVNNVNATAPSLLAHFDGIGLVTNPVDSSAYAFPGLLVGGAVLSAANTKFGSSSLLMAPSGTNGVYFDTSTDAHSCGTGDFTAECWFFAIAGSGSSYLLALADSGTISSSAQAAFVLECSPSSGTLVVRCYNGASANGVVSSPGSAFTHGVWNHVAVTRKSGTLYLFVNGVSVGSPSASASALNYATSMKFLVGLYNNNSLPNVYIDEVRFLKGEAYYFTNFTPPSAPF